jgi:hypothetical protein
MRLAPALQAAAQPAALRIAAAKGGGKAALPHPACSPSPQIPPLNGFKALRRLELSYNEVWRLRALVWLPEAQPLL